MKKTLSIALLSVTLAATALAGTVSPAAADTPGCATFNEYRQVTDGMRKARVNRILDLAGRLDGGSRTSEIRYYRGCSDNSGALITYDTRNNRVTDKQWS